MEALVSVVIPAFNAERFIGEAICSALAQTYRDLEIIVVDDGSTDATAQIVRSFGDRVRYLYQANARQAAARNTGIGAAKGEYIAFLDADDLWLPQKLERQIDLLRREPGLGLAYCSVELIDGSGRSLGVKRSSLRGHIAQAILLGQTRGLLNGSATVVPRTTLATVGTFDESLPPCEDTDFLWRVAKAFPVDFVDEPLLKYRVHGENAHLQPIRMARAWRLFYAKAARDPDVRALGLGFRARLQGRLYYMLAGDHALAGHWAAAAGFAVRAALWWPPTIGRMLWQLSHRRA